MLGHGLVLPRCLGSFYSNHCFVSTLGLCCFRRRCYLYDLVSGDHPSAGVGQSIVAHSCRGGHLDGVAHSTGCTS